MQMVTFVKSFSSGQITIPKAIRDQFAMPKEFWLKLYIEEDKIIAEPVVEELNKSSYVKKLIKIKGHWFNLKETAENRKQIEEQIINRSL